MLQFFRKYYTPGLISLVFLPLFSNIYLYKYMHPPKQYAVAMNMRSKAMDALSPYPFPPVRKYKGVELNGDKMMDSFSILCSDMYIRSIIAHNDTINGICIHLNHEAKYQSLVTLLDICQVDSAKIYGLSGDNFWIAPVTNHLRSTGINTVGEVVLISL